MAECIARMSASVPLLLALLVTGCLSIFDAASLVTRAVAAVALARQGEVARTPAGQALHVAEHGLAKLSGKI